MLLFNIGIVQVFDIVWCSDSRHFMSMVSHIVDFDYCSRVVYMCIDSTEPSGVGFDPSRPCHLHVQCGLYLVVIHVRVDPLHCPLRPLCGPHVPTLALPVRSLTSTRSQCILCALFYFDI